METSPQPAHTNRLINATSPYLLQHAHNPVDWYEWGEAALAKARSEDKPIFLSIGYSACHWCHVMAHESFEDETTAAAMNRHFVCIKVDREERPDIDEIYMQATMLANRGNGGWPMSVWLTPDLKPFLAGTYFPPESRWGGPGFKDLCEQIGAAWAGNREQLLANADQLSDAVTRTLSASSARDATFSLADIDDAVNALAGAFDSQRGGILSGGTNKFPPSMALDLFMRAIVRHGPEHPQSQRLRELVEVTLDNMANGGIYDHLAGGFARYSTDPEWHVPHFEKMLHDQALVSRAYLDAWQLTQRPLYRRIATEVFGYVLADLQSPAGGFYSSRDADSGGEEGRYYVWTRDEIVQALGPRDGEPFCSYYDVSETGNWSDPHAPGAAKNVLRVTRSVETVARLNQIDPITLQTTLAVGRQKLRELRSRRVPPGLDDKILVEWNGMMIASLARGGAVLGEPKYVQAAARAADFIIANQCVDGRLRRSYRDGNALETAFLSDYACLIEGLLELYEATFDRRWLGQAIALNGAAIEHYHDEITGGFFFTADDHEQLIARSKDVRDGATPCGNSVQLMNLLRLSTILGDRRLADMAEQTMNHFAADVIAMPGAGERFLAAVEFALLGPVEVVVVGDPADACTQALIRRINATYLPNRVLMLSSPANAGVDFKSPLLQDRPLLNGHPTAYVCRSRVCQQPATTPEDLAAQLTN